MRPVASGSLSARTAGEAAFRLRKISNHFARTFKLLGGSVGFLRKDPDLGCKYHEPEKSIIGLVRLLESTLTVKSSTDIDRAVWNRRSRKA